MQADGLPALGIGAHNFALATILKEAEALPYDRLSGRKRQAAGRSIRARERHRSHDTGLYGGSDREENRLPGRGSAEERKGQLGHPHDSQSHLDSGALADNPEPHTATSTKSNKSSTHDGNHR